MQPTTTKTQAHGAQLLQEISADECSLEDILVSIRNLHLPPTSLPCLPPALARLYLAHTTTGPLAIKNTPTSAASTALAHHILTYQLQTCGGAVALLDFTGRFSVAHLAHQCGKEDLQHLHIFRIVRYSSRICEAVKQWMLYGKHGSGSRAWVATILVGGEGTGPWDGMGGVLVSFGWKGWLNVAIDEIQEFDASTSVEQAWERRSNTESRCWKAWCAEGEYQWR